ncbi:phage holin family protein [Candidatus Peregrinibacteria bacterium]|nr:phage holin family protein [Candidatus Peregrinibacteria bacterium]
MKLSLPVQILFRFLLTILLVWAMATFMDQYFFLSGGFGAVIIVSALLTLMNLFVRPILNAATLPLRFLATILAIILVNGVFLWLTYEIVLRMDPNLVTLEILGGLGGWIVVALTIGLANWIMKMIVK